MTQCDCCHKNRRNIHYLLPGDRYVDIDPPGNPPGSALKFCDWWMKERERRKKVMDKRRGD